jgi:Domain of unknown function (DUF5348)
MPNTKDVFKQLQDLRTRIDQLLSSLDYSDSNIDLVNDNDPDELFLRNQCRSIVDRLNDINNELEYLSKPVIEQGVLRKKSNGRYCISEGYEFTSGSSIEVLIYDDFYECEEWVLTRVEHTNGDYYLYDLPNVKMAGLRARRR